MDSALIKDGTITNAKIFSLAVDKLYAASGTMASVIIGTSHITNAMIANAAVTNAKIGDYICSTNFGGSTSDPYTTPGTEGWCISKSGGAVFHNVKVRGDIEATSIKATSVDVVETLHVKNNAITATISAYTKSSITIDSSTYTTIQQASIVATGAPVHVNVCASLNLSYAGTGSNPTWPQVAIYRGGTLIYETTVYGGADVGNALYNWQANHQFSASMVDEPAAGTYTYSVKVKANAMTSIRTATNRAIALLEVKK